MGVADSWAQAQGAGVEFFIFFFGKHPDYQGKFSKLAGKSAAELQTLPAMKAQADTVMAAIDACVKAGGDKGALASAINPIAKTHVGYGVNAAMFKDALVCFKAFLGTKGISDAGWDDAIAAIVDAFAAGQK